MPATILDNALIGGWMAELPATSWAIMNEDNSGYCMLFDRTDYGNPKLAAEEWLDDQKFRLPGYVERNGYHVEEMETWPDYLGNNGESAATARFINWACRQPVLADAAAQGKVFAAVIGGKSIQVALAELLAGNVPEPHSP